ncbi:MAG: hypothetical protein ABIP19_10985 [Dermatophilaceae bacterium]
MNQTHTLDPVLAAALRRELVALPSAKPRRTRRMAAITAGVFGAVALGGVTAVAGLLPAGELASPPLAAPVILNGVGSANVVLPDAPGNAVYLRVELTCFDGIRCNTPGGGIEGPDHGTINKVQRDALPLTDAFDPHNAQDLARLNPAAGLAIDVSPGTHWRLYAVYTDGLNPEPAPVGNGKTLGIPSNQAPPDLVPAVATNGKSGWVDYHLLTDQADPQLTPEGTSQTPIPVYGADGTTVIGEADVSQPYHR